MHNPHPLDRRLLWAGSVTTHCSQAQAEQATSPETSKHPGAQVHSPYLYTLSLQPATSHQSLPALRVTARSDHAITGVCLLSTVPCPRAAHGHLGSMLSDGQHQPLLCTRASPLDNASFAP